MGPVVLFSWLARRVWQLQKVLAYTWSVCPKSTAYTHHGIRLLASLVSKKLPLKGCYGVPGAVLCGVSGVVEPEKGQSDLQ